MSLADLAIVYLVLGACCGVAIYRASPEPRARAAASAAVAVPLWPLWAPIALTARRGAPARHAQGGEAARIEAALRECVDACAAGPLESLLPRDAAERIGAGVRRAADRHAELGVLLARPDFDLAAAARRVAELERAGASARAVATARLHQDNVRRLHALRDRDARAMGELADLVQALRTQLTLARFGALGADLDGGAAGPPATASGQDIGGIVAEVWARVEGLGAAMEGDLDAARGDGAAGEA
jgi:hypothetical protein